jgi:hypothetical protein
VTTEIPDVRWGRTDSAVSRLATRFASTRVGSWTVRSLMPLDRKVLIRSNGRRTVLGPVGAPMLLLETTGRKSGLPRVSPLLRATAPVRSSWARTPGRRTTRRGPPT